MKMVGWPWVPVELPSQKGFCESIQTYIDTNAALEMVWYGMFKATIKTVDSLSQAITVWPVQHLTIRA